MTTTTMGKGGPTAPRAKREPKVLRTFGGHNAPHGKHAAGRLGEDIVWRGTSRIVDRPARRKVNARRRVERAAWARTQ